MSNTICYIGPFSFPNGGAAARRILGISKSLQLSGYKIKIASGQSELPNNNVKIIENIEVSSLNERTAEKLPRFLKHLFYFNMGIKTIRWLESLDEKPVAVILYSGYSPYLLRLIPWAKKRKVKLIFDAVEWYDPNTIFGFISPYQLNIELAMRFLVRSTRNVISISSYLQDYYIKQNCETILIPPTLDVLNINHHHDEPRLNKKIRLVYSGTPGKKDLLDEIIEAVINLRKRGYDFHLSIAGVIFSDVKHYNSIRKNSQSEIFDSISFLGTISHADSIKLVRNSHFSLLLRNDARYSKAGFPTKFVESLSVGTPVISNLTSDLNKYLTNERTGFVSNGPTSLDLENALASASNLNESQYSLMRDSCKKIATESFDYRLFAHSLMNFIQK